MHACMHACLACVVIYHTVDRACKSGRPSVLACQWMSESSSFSLIAEVAQSLKHGTRDWVKKKKDKNADMLLITSALGLNENLRDIELRNLHYQIKDAMSFIRKKAIACADKR